MPNPTRGRGEPSPQPHDALFKWTFSQPEHAAGLLRAALPPELVSAVDFATLRVENATFVNQALRSRYSDLVLSAQMHGQQAYFYTLIEQQRDIERLMVLRMDSCMVRLWEQLVRDDPTRKDIPLVIPILVHHSKTGWTAATAFQDVVAPEAPARDALLRYIPHFEVLLIDLSEGRPCALIDQALTALGKVVLRLLSVAGDTARLVRELRRVAAAIREVAEAPDAFAAFEAMVRYIVASHPGLSVKKVGRLLYKAAGPPATEAMMNVLDEIELKGERRGERRGRREGRREGRVKMLLQQMEARFGEVPGDVVARVEAAGEAALDRWAVRVLTAKTPEEVLDDTRATQSMRKTTASRKRPARARP